MTAPRRRYEAADRMTTEFRMSSRDAADQGLKAGIAAGFGISTTGRGRGLAVLHDADALDDVRAMISEVDPGAAEIGR